MSQTTVNGTSGAAGVAPEGVQGEQASVHGERGAPLEASQRRPEQPSPGVAHVGLALSQLQLPVTSQLGRLLQPPPVPQITAGRPSSLEQHPPSLPPLGFRATSVPRCCFPQDRLTSDLLLYGDGRRKSCTDALERGRLDLCLSCDEGKTQDFDGMNGSLFLLVFHVDRCMHR